MATHLLVGNPTAQSGKNEARIEQARTWLRDAGIACDLLATEPDGKTIAAVTRAIDAGGFACVIAMGGDGTFREVASGILDSTRANDVAMGMLPTGTANDQGRSFGLEAGEGALEANLAVLARANETRLDAGRIRSGDRTGWFFDSAGWGISARVLRERNADRALVDEKLPVLKALYRDHMVYAGALVRVFLESYVLSDKFDATVIADGETIELSGLTDLIVNATRVYAGAWVFDKSSAHDDGLFEVVPFLGKRDWTSKAIVALEAGPLTEEGLNAVGIRHSQPFSARDLTISMRPREGAKAIAAQLDGEECIAAPVVRIHVAKEAIRLVVPRDHASG